MWQVNYTNTNRTLTATILSAVLALSTSCTQDAMPPTNQTAAELATAELTPHTDALPPVEPPVTDETVSDKPDTPPRSLDDHVRAMLGESAPFTADGRALSVTSTATDLENAQGPYQEITYHLEAFGLPDGSTPHVFCYHPGFGAICIEKNADDDLVAFLGRDDLTRADVREHKTSYQTTFIIRGFRPASLPPHEEFEYDLELTDIHDIDGATLDATRHHYRDGQHDFAEEMNSLFITLYFQGAEDITHERDMPPTHSVEQLCKNAQLRKTSDGYRLFGLPENLTIHDDAYQDENGIVYIPVKDANDNMTRMLFGTTGELFEADITNYTLRRDGGSQAYAFAVETIEGRLSAPVDGRDSYVAFEHHFRARDITYVRVDCD